MTTLTPKYYEGATGSVNRPFSQKLQESVSVKDFGAVGDGVTDDTTAFLNALKSTTGTVYVPYTSTGYLVSNTLYLADSTYIATGIEGLGGVPIIKWSGFANTNNCFVVQSGATPAQWTIKNLTLNFNNCGLYGLYINAGNHAIVNTVNFLNSYRDALRIQCVDVGSSFNWFQAGRFSNLYFQSTGATPIVLVLQGTNGAFINEVLWENIDIRGASTKVIGSYAIFATSSATNAGSKFSCHVWDRLNIDAQYNTGATYYPATSAIVCDSGNCENWVFNGTTTCENTGTATSLNGYMLYQTGTGAFTNVTWGRNVQGGNLWGQGTNANGWLNEYTNGTTNIPGALFSKQVLVTTASLSNGSSQNIFTVNLGEVWLVTGNNSSNSAYNVVAIVAGQYGPNLQITHLVDGTNRQFIYGGASGSAAQCAIKINAGGPIAMTVTAIRLQ